ncbi:MAG: FGGY family carbohydrate kinase [Candidatus Omnitrophica bacterium]|nr:FGGY family carbohydrate kinase [Candidatus Omnitrophota bacterium]
MTAYVAAIDCGTTAIKAGIFDGHGQAKSLVTKLFSCDYHSDGGIEQDPVRLSQCSFNVLKTAIRRSKVHPREIAALSVSSQRATIIPTDREFHPVGNALSWQDMRGAGEIEKFKKQISDRNYYHITGVPNHPVFSLAKILWLKRKSPDGYRKAKRFALVHDYLLRELGCPDFFCDWSNASLTGLLDIGKFQWSEALLKLTGLRLEKLPYLVPSGAIVGTVSSRAARRCGLQQGTPIVAGGGDQQCAGIGAGAVEPGIIEITLGTAGVCLGTVEKPVRDPKMRISCCAHAVPGKWCVEGLQNAAVACLHWLRDQVFDGKMMTPKLMREIAGMNPGSEGVMFYPFLAGSSAPHWNPYAKAMFCGLTYVHGRPHLARAVMEGVSLETKQILDVFVKLKMNVREIRLTGGGSDSKTWNQIQADIYHRRVATLKFSQASLLGAAVLAAYGVGIFKTISEAVRKMVTVSKTYVPDPKKARLYEKLYDDYCMMYDGMEKNRMWMRSCERKTHG